MFRKITWIADLSVPIHIDTWNLLLVDDRMTQLDTCDANSSRVLSWHQFTTMLSEDNGTLQGFTFSSLHLSIFGTLQLCNGRDNCVTWITYQFNSRKQIIFIETH